MIYIILTIILMAIYFYQKLNNHKEISWSSIGCWSFICIFTTIMLIVISKSDVPLPPTYKFGGYGCSCFILLVSSAILYTSK
jgi:hypothetical protein